eukprot:9452515-Karenia_brevis.AAC.1
MHTNCTQPSNIWIEQKQHTAGQPPRNSGQYTCAQKGCENVDIVHVVLDNMNMINESVQCANGVQTMKN